MTKKDISFTEKQMELASKLTPLQRKFIIELIKPRTSQRQAYIKAGGTAKTENAQDQGASRMLSQAKVKAFYEAILEVQTIDSIMTRDEALERLSKSARIKITDICTFKYVEFTDKETDEVYMNTVWTMKDAEDIDPDVAACIKSVTFTKAGPKIELYDANGSIKMLSDIQGWSAPKRTEVTGRDGQALQLNANVEAPEVASALAGLIDKL